MVIRYRTAMTLAAVLMAVTFLAHLVAGSAELYAPLRQSDYPAPDKSVFSVIWHFVSVLLLLMTLSLGHLSRHPSGPLFLFILLTVLAFGALFLAYSLVDFGSIWTMPQWIAFFGVAALMGARAKRQ